jgi:hypothetical protein
LYKVAFGESQRALDDQVDELNQARQRAVAFLAFVGTATGFLVGSGLKNTTRSPLFYALAALGTLLALAALACLFYLLSPVRREEGRLRKAQWEYRLSGTELMSWIDAEVGQPSEYAYIAAVTNEYETMIGANDKTLSYLRRAYVMLIVLGLLQLTVWTTLAWAFA